ncbi:MAG: hypothetical protein ACI84D_003770 [Thalassolituus oleivorans]|jgi:hypothetical protein
MIPQLDMKDVLNDARRRLGGQFSQIEGARIGLGASTREITLNLPNHPGS